MEYAVAVGDGPECLKAVAAVIRKRHVNTGFPIEYRTVAQDDVWLSPFYKRPSATIAVHQYHRVNTDKLFGPCEAVFRRFEGRPHWGKRTRARKANCAIFIRSSTASAKIAVPQELGPARVKFLNPYLKELFRIWELACHPRLSNAETRCEGKM